MKYNIKCKENQISIHAESVVLCEKLKRKRKHERKVMSSSEALLYRYAELLNECTIARLTGTRGADEIYTQQVMDSLPSVEYLPKSGKVIDVGSGGGLPGIVWALLRPDLNITLLDSVKKKCTAMREITASLGIMNAEVICARSEDFARNKREEFDLAGAKGLAVSGVCAELLSPLVKVSGKVLTFKGAKVKEEISEVQGKWLMLGLSRPTVKYYGGESRSIVIWEKVKKCPLKYPRNCGAAELKHFWE